MSRVEQIGDCTLYLGDCLDILPTLPKVDAVITDPPYGINDKAFNTKSPRVGKRFAGNNTWHSESWWDSEINSEWGIVCSIAPIVAWFGHWRKREDVCKFMSHPIRAEIVWAKDCHSGPPCPVASRDERIWVFAENGIVGATFETSVWDVPVIPTWAFKNHKNEKPVVLMSRLIAWINPSSIVDPFMGSGSTGVASIKLGKKFFGIEIEQKNFDIACRRIEEATKQAPLIPFEQPKQEQEALL